jgi:hypothetical protein
MAAIRYAIINYEDVYVPPNDVKKTITGRNRNDFDDIVDEYIENSINIKDQIWNKIDSLIRNYKNNDLVCIYFIPEKATETNSFNVFQDYPLTPDAQLDDPEVVQYFDTKERQINEIRKARLRLFETPLQLAFLKCLSHSLKTPGFFVSSVRNQQVFTDYKDTSTVKKLDVFHDSEVPKAEKIVKTWGKQIHTTNAQKLFNQKDPEYKKFKKVPGFRKCYNFYLFLILASLRSVFQMMCQRAIQLDAFYYDDNNTIKSSNHRYLDPKYNTIKLVDDDFYTTVFDPEFQGYVGRPPPQKYLNIIVVNKKFNADQIVQSKCFQNKILQFLPYKFNLVKVKQAKFKSPFR